MGVGIAALAGARWAGTGGGVQVTVTVSAPLCGGFAQVVDSVSCATSNPAQLPR